MLYLYGISSVQLKSTILDYILERFKFNMKTSTNFLDGLIGSKLKESNKGSHQKKSKKTSQQV